MQLLQILKLILTILPLVIETMKAIEAAIPGQGQGEAKLAAVRGILEGAYKGATDVSTSFEEVWPYLSNTISTMTTLFNKTGVFKK